MKIIAFVGMHNPARKSLSEGGLIEVENKNNNKGNGQGGHNGQEHNTDNGSKNTGR